MISSPGSGARLGFLSRLDLEVDSCQHDLVSSEWIVTGANGDGRRTNNKALSVPTGGGYASNDENGITATATVTDLAAAGGVALGSWESGIDYSVCAIQSADDTTYTFT